MEEKITRTKLIYEEKMKGESGIPRQGLGTGNKATYKLHNLKELVM